MAVTCTQIVATGKRKGKVCKLSTNLGSNKCWRHGGPKKSTSEKSPKKSLKSSPKKSTRDKPVSLSPKEKRETMTDSLKNLESSWASVSKSNLKGESFSNKLIETMLMGSFTNFNESMKGSKSNRKK